MPADYRLEHALDRVRGGVAGGDAKCCVREGSITDQTWDDHGGGERRHEHVGPTQRLEQVRGAVAGGALVSRRGVSQRRVQRDGSGEEYAAHEPPVR
jgi:hypothetical protein